MTVKKVVLHLSIILIVVTIPSVWIFYTSPTESEGFYILIAQGFSSIVLFILPPIYLVVYWLIPELLIKRRYFLFATGVLLTVVVFGYFIGYVEPLVDEYLFGMKSTAGAAEYGLVVMAFLLVVTILLNLSYRWFIQLSVMKQMENDHLKKELSLLKNQINPHFFFNTLNNLYALSLEKSEETPKVILKLSQLMRYSIYECGAPFVDLEKEVTYIENYIALQQIRKLDAKIELKKNISDPSIKIAPLILIVLLENAFKHGVDSLPNGAEVLITLNANEEYIYFEVKNNFSASKANTAGGVGLENVKKRLSLIYGASYDFSTIEQDDIFTALLKIKL